jgi:nitrite reductase/ring-hydroxylating ferredoxin subunit
MHVSSELTAPVAGTRPGPDYIRLFRDHPDKQALLAEIRNTAFEGIELLAGRRIRTKVEQDGLARLHRYFPAEHVSLLQTYIAERTTRRVVTWSARLGRESMGITDDFHVQDLLIVRLHYPHDERAAPVTTMKPPSTALRLRWGFGARIESIKALLASRTALRHPMRVLKYLRQRQDREQELLPYRCHGPHLDSWLGQPIGALSVWLAVAGVEQDNSMCLYPETVNQPLPQSSSLFLGSGRQLPKPTRPDIQDGDVYVFSTEILHSSQVNVSGKTRFALTTRISTGTPVFDGSNLWFIERWHTAGDLLAGRYRCTTINASEHALERPPARPRPVSEAIHVDAAFRPGHPTPVASSASVPNGKRLAVQFAGGDRILVLRVNGQLTAFSSRCPHSGYSLEDGWYEGARMACPGHGLEFDAVTGASKADCFRLMKFDATEKDGTIYLG